MQTELLEALKPREGGLPTGKVIELFSGTVPDESVKAGLPQNLLDAYGIKWEQLVEDARIRPDHYTAREVEIIQGHALGAQPLRDTHYSELNELAVKFFESTQNRRKRQEVLGKVTKPKDVADDPMTITDETLQGKTWAERQATFENQAFGDDLKKFI